MLCFFTSQHCLHFVHFGSTLTFVRYHDSVPEKYNITISIPKTKKNSVFLDCGT